MSSALSLESEEFVIVKEFKVVEVVDVVVVTRSASMEFKGNRKRLP